MTLWHRDCSIHTSAPCRFDHSQTSYVRRGIADFPKKVESDGSRTAHLYLGAEMIARGGHA